MGLDAFPSSAATAGIGPAERGDLLRSHGLGKASHAAIKAGKATVIAAALGLFSLSASPCFDNKSFTGSEEGSAHVWVFKEEFQCLWEDWLTLRPGECPSDV